MTCIFFLNVIYLEQTRRKKPDLTRDNLNRFSKKNNLIYLHDIY